MAGAGPASGTVWLEAGLRGVATTLDGSNTHGSWTSAKARLKEHSQMVVNTEYILLTVTS